MRKNKISASLAKLSDNVGAFIIICMMILISCEVIARSIFNTSTLISDEYSGYMMVLVTYWGAASAFHSGSFVRVEAIFERFNSKVKKVLNFVYEVLFLVFNSYMCYYFFQSCCKVFRHHSVSSSVSRTPLYIPYGLCWLGIFIFELYLIFSLIECIVPEKKEEEK